MTIATAGSIASEAARILEGRAIVYFGNDWSAENRTSSHHIARRLSTHCPLLYVEVPGMRPPQATGRDLRKLWRKLKQALQPPRRVGEQMWRITMPQLPFRRWAILRTLNRACGSYLVNRAMRRLQLKRPISWFVVPHAADLAGCLAEDLIVYYCTDDYASMPNVDSHEVARMDEDLTRRADQVFVTSATLLDRKRQLNPNVEHAPHGVDVDLFRRAAEPDTPTANAACGLKRPVIGFFGLIEAWIDLDLIAFLARRRPAWSFLLVGRLAVNAGELRNMPNVMFAGPQPYESLPEWAKAFDVAIIPYRMTHQVLHANPLKLREYLATGKPVVAVSTPAIRQFAGYVHIAETQEEFLNGIERALAEDSELDRVRRMQAVAGLSWDCRVEEVLRVVTSRLSERLTIGSIDGRGSRDCNECRKHTIHS